MAEVEPSATFPFDDAEQQRHAAGLGMWTFLVTEVMFFGGLLTGYAVYRLLYHEAFADGSHHLYMWVAAANTAVLLLSSTSMVLAVEAAKALQRRAVTLWLLITVGLGSTFLALKVVEFWLDWRDRVVPGEAFDAAKFADPGRAELFFVFYFVMTGLHFVHVTAGVAVNGGLLLLARRGRARPNAVEMAGLYWHFVDVVWIFLFPLLYLIR